MAKLNWQKVYKKGTTRLQTDYWNNPKQGFDNAWHQQQANKKEKQDRHIRDKALAMIRANKSDT